MIYEHFDNLNSYSVINSAQIEPTHSEDPDEIYRLAKHRPGVDLHVDVAFYPGRIRLMPPESSKSLATIQKSKIDSSEKLEKWLDFYVKDL